jgi:hypothetical protein
MMTKVQRFVRRVVPSGILASGLVLLGAACSKDATDPGAATATPHVTASVAGTDWKANYLVEVAIGDLYGSENRVEVVGLEISPSYAGRQISLRLSNFTGVGTYALGPQSSGTWGFYVTSSDVRTHTDEVTYTTQRTDAGTVTVTSFDATSGHIAGTFTVEVASDNDPTSSIRIANGSFDGHLAPGA